MALASCRLSGAHADTFEEPDICRRFADGPKSGDDLLTLLNKKGRNQLRGDYVPKDLRRIESDWVMPERQEVLRHGVALALNDLLIAAREAGFRLGVRSAFRSFEAQCQVFALKLREHGEDYANAVSALPGRSQHQLGTTVDLSSPGVEWELSTEFARKKEGRWLAEHAHLFGFILAYPEEKTAETGYAFEPWHFRYVGLEAAREMREKNIDLEEYLSACATQQEALECPREYLPPLPNQGFVGGACAKNSDCGSLGADGFCLGADEGYPEGHCTTFCDATCPDATGPHAKTFCADTKTGDGGFCHAMCDFDLFPHTGCRADYECRIRYRPGKTVSAHVCVPK
jgi:LAS superfamily LD-carboxypeptidase LdcB